MTLLSLFSKALLSVWLCCEILWNMNKSKIQCRIPRRPTTCPSEIPKSTEALDIIQSIVKEEIANLLPQKLQSGSEITLKDEINFEEESAYKFLKSIADVDRLLSVEKRLENLENKYEILLTTIHMHLNRSDIAETDEENLPPLSEVDCNKAPWMISLLNPNMPPQRFPCLRFCPPNQNYVMRDVGHSKRISRTIDKEDLSPKCDFV